MPKLSRTELLQKVQDWPAEKIVALTLWGEIRGGAPAEVWNVANVIRNRVRGFLRTADQPDWWGEGWIGVCTAQAQFSCWWDTQQERMLALAETDQTYQRMLAVAKRIIDGKEPDPVGGATHYHTIAQPSYARVWPPTWAPAMQETGRDTKHVFLRDPAVKYPEDAQARTPGIQLGPALLTGTALTNLATQTGAVKEAAQNLGIAEYLPMCVAVFTAIAALCGAVWYFRRAVSQERPWALWLHSKLPKMPWEKK